MNMEFCIRIIRQGIYGVITTLFRSYHRDDNILFAEKPEGVSVEIIDLNRMRFGKVSLEEGCKNFERLPGTDEMFAVLADEYAKSRGFDKKKCLQLIEKAHKSSSSFSSKAS